MMSGLVRSTYIAFLRRENNDYCGLSIAPTRQDAESGLATKLGSCKLVAGDARQVDAGVEVTPDTPQHGNITGVPRKSEDYELALKIANALERAANKHLG